jgi:hypothetical protein
MGLLSWFKEYIDDGLLENVFDCCKNVNNTNRLLERFKALATYNVSITACLRFLFNHVKADFGQRQQLKVAIIKRE